MTLLVSNPISGTDISIFPNPATNSIQISDLVPGRKIALVRLYDVTGKLVRTSTLKNTNSIDVSMLKDGLYFAELATNENEIPDSRFIKK